jgi:hypothetical protein
MLSKLKTYAIAILGALAAFAGFMWQMTRAKHERALKRGIQDARKVENKATDAMIEGLEKEDEIKNDNSTDRDKFLN